MKLEKMRLKDLEANSLQIRQQTTL